MRWTDPAAALVALMAAMPAAAQSPGAAPPVAQVPASPAPLTFTAPLSSNDWVAGKGTPPAPATSWRPGDPIPEEALRRRPPPPGAVPAPPRAAPQAAPRPARDPGEAQGTADPDPRPVATSAAVAPVGVTRLSDGNPDAKGTLSAADAGLPRTLWGAASADEIAAALKAYDPRLPATRTALRRLLTVQVDPPAGSLAGREGALFLARVDRLVDLGWVWAAEALLQVAGPGNADIVRRRFDLAMLTGDESRVCDAIGQRPGLAPDLAARVYCLAQDGDWAAAALTLHGAQAGGLIPDRTAGLLSRFLDDAAVDRDDIADAPGPDLTPLEFRLYEAIGQPVATSGLPIAFARADLRGENGWKARIEAAERLARVGAGEAEMLAAVYLEQAPAASGGVWERTRAFQALDRALADGDRATLARDLPTATALFAEAGLAPALARAVAARLPAQGLDGDALQAATRLRLLAGIAVPTTQGLAPEDAWLVRLAVAEASAPDADAQGTAVPAGLPPLAAMLAQALDAPVGPEGDKPDSLGLALFAALGDVDAGLAGDDRRAAAGVARLAALGQGTLAREAAVQLLLLPRMGARP